MKFEDWLDCVLEVYKEKAKGYNINLYDNGGGQYSAELVGCSSFDENDSDWACDKINNYCEVYNEFRFTANNWIKALDIIVSAAKDYLRAGKFAKVLKKAKGVAVGFVDGDLEIIYEKHKLKKRH